MKMNRETFFLSTSDIRIPCRETIKNFAKPHTTRGKRTEALQNLAKPKETQRTLRKA